MEITALPAITRAGHTPGTGRSLPERRAPDQPPRQGEWLGSAQADAPAVGGLTRHALAAVWYRWVATLDLPDTPPRLDLHA